MLIETLQDERYAFAVGKIRVLETRLIKTPKYQRLADAVSPDELVSQLQDTDYAGYIERPEEYPSMIKSVNKWLQGLMDKYIIDAWALDFLKSHNDFHNLRVWVKSKLQEVKPPNILLGWAKIEPESWDKILEEERWSEIPTSMRDAIEESITTYYMSKDMRLVDITIDRHLWRYRLELSKPSSWLYEFTKLEIDLYNIETFMRYKFMKLDRKILHTGLVDGGTVDSIRLIEIADDPIESLPMALRFTPYEYMVGEIVKDWKDPMKFFILWDKVRDNLTLPILKMTIYYTFGVDPIIAYFLARKLELRLLKFIFIAKFNEIPTDLVKCRIPDVY